MSAITIDFTLDKLVEKLVKDEHFSFSRYGDGEMAAVKGKQGRNCDGHIYYEALGHRLFKILESAPDYYVGLQGLAYRQSTDFIDALTDRCSIKWCASDILHHASIKNTIYTFFAALNNKNVILVGPSRLARLNTFKIDTHLTIPDLNCWNGYTIIKDKLMNNVVEGDVVLYCASMMTNVLIDDMYKIMGNKITQIDCGSVFEPYIGHSNRTYHAKKITELQNV